jgi:undecaprenyl diphosphate synthase
MSNDTAETLKALGLTREQLPRHIAIIMDGNGRWARAHGEHRIAGHIAGVESVRAVLRECGRLGVDVLTLYSFSTENWKRPANEVAALMELLVKSLVGERDELMANHVRVRWIGRRSGLPQTALDELDATIAMTRENTGVTLCLAINYGSRAEIIDAVQSLARDVAAGRRAAEAIDEAAISDALHTAGMPDPDLLIRTANERRLSNFLLWQISYAEIYVTPVLWPDFREPQLHEALRDYAGRKRRYGGLGPQPE